MRSFTKDRDDGCYWWRSLVEFRTKPELFAAVLCSTAETVASTPRLRVIKEMERLALGSYVCMGKLRDMLQNYEAGDLYFPAGGVSKQNADIPPVVTIILHGLAGSGKSSLIDLMYSVLGKSGIIPFAHTTTNAGIKGRRLCLEEHNVLRSTKNGFCVFDTKGLDYNRLAEGLIEVDEWLQKGIRHNQLYRDADHAANQRACSNSAATAKQFLKRKVNCVMVVANLSEIQRSCTAGDMGPLEATRELYQSQSIDSYCNEKPILVLTHGDELAAEERIEGRVRVCEYLGVPETTVYDVACLNEHGAMVEEMDPVTAYSLAEAVYRALAVADRRHPLKRSLKEWVALVLLRTLAVLSTLKLTFLAALCSKKII